MIAGIALGSIDEASIRALVHGFYGKVMDDPLLAPVFGREIAAGAWPAHLGRMCDFWSNVLIRSGRYDGRPLPPHLALDGIGDDHFARWLALFAETAREAFAGDDARRVIATAERIGHSFRIARAMKHGGDSTALTMIRADGASVTRPSGQDRS